MRLWRKRNPGRHYRSKEKQRDYTRAYRKKNPTYRRKSYLKATYALTTEAYEALYQAQNGKCKICDNFCPEGEILHVDHDHLTGRVRGLLCRKCNTMLGFAEDDIKRLEKAIAYLNA